MLFFVPRGKSRGLFINSVAEAFVMNRVFERR